MRPKKNSRFAWGKLVRYHIKVSDQEDGESQYQEIASNEVFLKVTYVNDLSQLDSNIGQLNNIDSLGLATIKKSNCLNCHNFKSKALGPSFASIAKRYQDTDSNIRTLENHIKQGSSGVWGQASMPSHSELSKNQLHNIVNWIMERAADSTTNYYVGTSGTFKMQAPLKPNAQSGIILTASYTDHGTKKEPHKTLRDTDHVIIHGINK